MAGNIPTPRSYQSILGDMLDAFLSRYGLTGLKIGGPILTILEAAAQSDTRNTQDIFNLLDVLSFDRATGLALDLHAADEDTVRRAATQTTGKINVYDTSFEKVSTTIYSGTSAPNAGTTTINVVDASSFPATGEIYIGRNSTNYEGPISYSVAPSQTGSYWTITLDSGTTKFHNTNETVILAQGGNRTIPAGTVVQTPQGNVSSSVQFTTLSPATIEDGEVSVEGIEVVCQQPGVIGNVPADAITEISGSPFEGAGVTNPLPFTNGLPAEDDDALRERIRNLRQSRSKATPLALITNAVGVTATDENKTVASATVVTPKGEPATLYIDDGSGYEETSVGVAIETLVDEALGGEQYFELSSAKPVTKAFVATKLTAPFNLEAGMTLAVKVNGVLTEHSFSASEFREITNASAYEVVAAINGNSELLFSAATVDGGTRIKIFARADSNEDVEVTEPSDATDANVYLGFPTGVNYTLRLFKNDRLLMKDGKIAKVSSAPQSQWSASITSGVQVDIAVDGTPSATYTFTDSDFVDANTGFTSVSASNSLDAWAEVFNSKVPGITATVEGGQLVLASNRGTHSNSMIEISAPSGVSNNLVTYGMFTEAYGLQAEGQPNDYTLDRNTGQIKLTAPLEEGDALAAGTIYTRAYVEGGEIESGLLTIDEPATFWVAVDGDPEILSTNITAATSFTVTDQGNNKVRFLSSTANSFVSGGEYLIREGDWVILWDENWNARGAWKISFVHSGGTYFEIERELAAAESGTLATSGITFVRSTTPIQQIRIAAGTNRSLSSVVDEINSSILGATASVYRNRHIRISTDSFGTGDIMVVAADVEAQKLLLPTDLEENTAGHIASVEAGNSGFGTPEFTIGTVASLDSAKGFTPNVDAEDLGVSGGSLIAWMRRNGTVSYDGHGTNAGAAKPIHSITTLGVVNVRTGEAEYDIAVGDMARSGSTVTVAAAGHTVGIGDIVYVSPGEADFAAGYKIVTAVTGSSFSYSEAGAATTNASPQTIGVSGKHLVDDVFCAMSPYSIGPNDSISVLIDEDPASKSFNVPLYRRMKPASGASYSASGFAITDTDNGNAVPAAAFGTTDPDFFADFAVYMKARGKSHNTGSSNKTVLWRFGRFGPEGNQAIIEYVRPTAPNQALSVTTQNGENVKIKIRLPSGSARTGLSLYPGTRFNVTVGAGTANAELVTYSYSTITITTNNLVRASNVVTATSATAHGYEIGDVVYVTSADPDFASGPKTLTAVTSTTFSYIEAGSDGSNGVGAATVSSVPIAPDFSGVSVGDIVYIDPASGFTGTKSGDMRVAAATSTTFSCYRETGTVSASTTPIKLGNADYLKFFPIDTTTTVTDIVDYINDPANELQDVVSAVVVNGGGGSPGSDAISMATEDEFFSVTVNDGASSVRHFPLFDGVNYVKESDLSSSSGPNTISFKQAVESTLLSAADFENEELRLVPITTASLVKYLNSAGVGGLYGSSEIVATGVDAKLQLSSLTIGSGGAIRVSGGSANSTSATVVGAAEVVDSDFAKVTVRKDQSLGLVGGRFVACEGAVNAPKQTNHTGSTDFAIAEFSENVWMVGFSTGFGTRRLELADPGDKLRIEQVGSFARYSLVDDGSPLNPIFALSGVQEGDWVQIELENGNAANVGVKQVVRVDENGFWVEGSVVNEVVEIEASDIVTFWSYDMPMPGDQLEIDTDAFGVKNQGTFEVSGIGSETTIYVSGDMQTLAATPMGSNYVRVRFVTNSPIRLIKKIHTIGQNPDDAEYVDVILTPSTLADKIGASSSVTLKALDKLDFDTSIVSGFDAYSYTTGLIGEVTRVIYGDLSNPTLYPAVVAAGANVNVSAPLVKRIQTSLAIRTATGVRPDAIVSRVKSIVASVINKSPLGKPIDISSIVAAARSVNGVVSVTVLSPTFSSGNDLINVQANEKPMVLDIESDVLVTLVGA